MADEKAEQITYIYIGQTSINTSLYECSLCGNVFRDEAKHNKWHETKDGY